MFSSCVLLKAICVHNGFLLAEALCSDPHLLDLAIIEGNVSAYDKKENTDC